MELIAHRGGRGFGVDNTLEAMEAAERAGVRYIETDLRWTADNKLIVCHDTTVFNHIISHTTYSELKNHAPERPLLEDVLESLAGWVRFDLEVKQAPPWAVREALYEYRIELDTLITSFDIDFLGDFKKRCPEVRTGLLFRSPFSFHKKCLAATACGAEVLLPYFHDVKPEFLKDAHRSGLEVYAWTVNEIPDLERLIGWGIDGIVTDRYLQFRNHLNEMGHNRSDGSSASARRYRR